MKKNRIIAFLLSVVLLFGVATPALADQSGVSNGITPYISPDRPVSKTFTYEINRVVNGTSSALVKFVITLTGVYSQVDKIAQFNSCYITASGVQASQWKAETTVDNTTYRSEMPITITTSSSTITVKLYNKTTPTQSIIYTATINTNGNVHEEMNDSGYYEIISY